MAALLTVLRVFIPALLKSAEDGTLLDIVETGIKLIGLVEPLLSDPRSLAAVNDLAGTLAGIASAQPEDPVFSRQGAAKFGGR